MLKMVSTLRDRPVDSPGARVAVGRWLPLSSRHVSLRLLWRSPLWICCYPFVFVVTDNDNFYLRDLTKSCALFSAFLLPRGHDEANVPAHGI